jgi:hypothetical protein
MYVTATLTAVITDITIRSSTERQDDNSSKRR